MKDTGGKVILITGTSTGLGLSIAVKAAAQGHKVYATMRSLKKKAALEDAAREAGVALDILALDTRDTAIIDSCVGDIITAEGTIDVLINNAGVGFARSTEQASEEDIRWVVDTNLMGVIRTTKAVIPHMRVARSGHIVNITSVGGLIGQPFNEVYCATKFAVEGYTESLACYLTQNFGIHFTAVEPGGISTEFANSALSQVKESGGLLDDEYLPILQQYLSSRDPNDNSMYQTPDEVADIVLQCVDEADPPIRLRTSAWAESLCELKTSADPDGKKARFQVRQKFLRDTG